MKRPVLVRRHRPLRGGQSQPRAPQAPHQVTTPDRFGTQRQRPVPDQLGNVVVVPLERHPA